MHDGATPLLAAALQGHVEVVWGSQDVWEKGALCGAPEAQVVATSVWGMIEEPSCREAMIKWK